jgi:putative flippase GtrA
LKPAASVALLRYAAVGAIATAVHYALLAWGVEMARWPAWLASGVGAVVGAQVAFIGNRRFTFGHDGTAAAPWLKFQLTALFGALLGMGVVGLAVHAGWHYLVAQVLATLLVVGVTFIINRHWTFE